jgi:hypothetical protein
VESKISRLKDKFHSDALRQPQLFEEGFSEMSARTFEVVNRSVALLKSSVLLRFYASQMRLEAGLVRHALFLKANREQDSSVSFAPPNVVADRSDGQESRDATDLTPACPSPREREVLHFLADGKSNKEIGLILEINTRTVEAYRVAYHDQTRSPFDRRSRSLRDSKQDRRTLSPLFTPWPSKPPIACAGRQSRRCPSFASPACYLAKWRTLKEIGSPIKNMCTSSP